MSTTAPQSPVVSPVAPIDAPELVDRLNGWRDEMPAVAAGAESQAFALTVNGETVGGYLLTNIGPASEIQLLAIDPAHRRNGHGRMCCMDALFRSGKRPLVLNADEASAGFAKAVGFKIIGKRRLADGGSMYRFGWHAPRPGSEPNKAGC
jgi:ribosomal protein S18 acetylase RimI-like enzyme